LWLLLLKLRSLIQSSGERCMRLSLYPALDELSIFKKSVNVYRCLVHHHGALVCHCAIIGDKKFVVCSLRYTCRGKFHLAFAHHQHSK